MPAEAPGDSVMDFLRLLFGSMLERRTEVGIDRDDLSLSAQVNVDSTQT